MSGTKAHSGGRRLGAGRLPQVFHLSKEAARSLATLTGHAQMLNPCMTSLEVVERLILQAEADLNEIIERNAEIALEGEREYLDAATTEKA